MLDSVISTTMTLGAFVICVGSALVLGVLTALVFTAKAYHSDSWVISIAALPAVVAVVIMMVNGNIGAGLAVAGTFALVRFRSVPGSAREITGLFFAVSLGLMCGMGYVVLAGIFFVIMAAFILLLGALGLGRRGTDHRTLKITIPEDMDYEGIFDDLFDTYTKSHRLLRVRTTNMGTLFELTYEIVIRDDRQIKAFIDDIRCRNGNLNITCGRETDKDLM